MSLDHNPANGPTDFNGRNGPFNGRNGRVCKHQACSSLLISVPACLRFAGLRNSRLTTVRGESRKQESGSQGRGQGPRDRVRVRETGSGSEGQGQGVKDGVRVHGAGSGTE